MHCCFIVIKSLFKIISNHWFSLLLESVVIFYKFCQIIRICISSFNAYFDKLRPVLLSNAVNIASIATIIAINMVFSFFMALSSLFNAYSFSKSLTSLTVGYSFIIVVINSLLPFDIFSNESILLLSAFLSHICYILNLKWNPPNSTILSKSYITNYYYLWFGYKYCLVI